MRKNRALMPLGLLLLGMILLITGGCGGKQLQPTEEIISVFEKHNVALIHQESCDYLELNNRKPSCYSYLDGQVVLYIFNNKAQVNKVLKQFNSMKEQHNRVIPQLFSSEEILFMYYTSEERTDPYVDRNEALVEVEQSLQASRTAVN